MANYKNKPQITRRDFLNGCALSLAAGTGLSPLEAVAQGALDASALPPDYYPPTLQGLRGSHEGSFEIAHAMRDGQTWQSADAGDGHYDLIVVGGGISGLAAAYFFRKQHGPQSRILILDNHDDFGGHAKRNEFWHEGRMFLVNGGTLNVEAPSQYSTVAAGLLWELGIDRTRYFEKNRDMFSFYRDMGLTGSMFFDKENFGEDKLVVGYNDQPIAEAVAKSPLSADAQRDVVRLYNSTENYFPGLSAEETRQRLTHMSYKDYLLNVVQVHEDVVKLFHSSFYGSLVVSPDAIPAIYFRDDGYPGFSGLNLEDLPPELLVNEPGGQHGRENIERARDGDPDMYFPDGNATITRLLVRSLVPGAVTGKDMEDVVTAAVDYSQLDRRNNDCRIRLNSTVVQVENQGTDQVKVQYVNNDQAYAVTGAAVVMACWNTVIPYICPEIPAPQKEALVYGTKSPLVYGGALLRNWQSFVDTGISRVSAPTSFYSSIGLQPSVTMGDYQAPRDPDEPIVMRFSAYFDVPGRELNRREQHRAGRNEMLATSFATFEDNLRDQLTRILGPAGFDDERDILGITVNRWPHGYSYSYNPLYEPEEWAYTSTDQRPCIVGRQRVGRIAIANADAAASPHTDASINEAYRAVNELLSM
ncbi:MAG: NAD(P)/FAD-dependent oxidoreductase [Pseudomonadales bacterium]|nr:NAD(P)/FAD-dependent oxidoreductase [Pseudomonadales bacterium]